MHEIILNSLQGVSFASNVFFIVQVYTERDEWDCISTCFFIDCANNIVAFIETIYNILKPGQFLTFLF
jgi:carnosine N-methyltransferase